MAVENLTFKQDPQLGWEKFIIQNNDLVIVGESFGLKKEIKIKLSDISPRPQFYSKRLHHRYIIPLLFSAGPAAIAYYSIQRAELSNPSYLALTLASFAFAMCFVWYAIRGYKPIEACCFIDKNREKLFEIYRPIKSPWIYEDFISNLIKRINNT
jgi:hypothetical protein